MLSESYLWNVPDSVVDIWSEIEDWMIKDICRRIMSADLYNYDALPGAARWRILLLNEAGIHYEELIKKIAQITHKSEAEICRLFEESGIKNIGNETSVYKQQGIDAVSVLSSPAMLNVLQQGYTRTNGEIHNFTRTMADSSQKLLIDTLDKAYFEVTSGAKSYTEVIKDAVETVGKESGIVRYPSGHKDTVETAVRRSVLTGINQTAGKVTLQNAIDIGAEYVVISAHVGARTSDDPIANHAGWQGKIYKIVGHDKKYQNLKEGTGFPDNPLGLCGYNCRHTIHAWFPGEPNPFEGIVKDQTFSDKQYELSQKQRYMERNIRNLKRQLIAYETAIVNCKDDKTKFELQNEYDKTSARLQKWNKRYRDFCKNNAEYGIKTKQERLRTLGWDREHADRARSGAGRYRVSKEKAGKVTEYNTGKAVSYNEKYDYNIRLSEFSDEVNKGMSQAAENVAKYGSRDKYEYLQLVDLKSGKLEPLITDKDTCSVGGRDFWKFIEKHKDVDYAFVHNHNTNSAFSETDMRTLLTTENIKVMIAVRNDAVIYVAERAGEVLHDAIFDRYYLNDLNELNNQCKNGIITIAERSRRREEIIVKNLLRDYTKQKGLYEIDGRK